MFTRHLPGWSAPAPTKRPSARLRQAGELLSALVVCAAVALGLWASGCSAVVAEPSRCENTAAACAARCAPCPASWSGNYCTFAGCVECRPQEPALDRSGPVDFSDLNALFARLEALSQPSRPPPPTPTPGPGRPPSR
jgi:hypothetical protein